ncbi:DNA gyrase, subunit B domain protein [Alkaliphilus metalliredigens QYMF]|uniref:DNA topoisomerase (ATP-hydrolyzing) n=1 Tax=Alkaliphilus metalliredigens (strain QYMF) TaxID=293826 RepID=A6TSS9_ALKMQ|nr:toprim domain-containing protein [Alkaliphilus metalliredigens]ABR49247.1 DNA gyrase, subunit B domain protein [Alkaliphilus metalliredigens QYMF]
MTDKKKQEYGNESISSLTEIEKVRLRPQVIFGSDGITGSRHTVDETVANSVDEAKEGFGKLIKVKRFKDRSISVQDFARGIPVEFNSKENKYNWELVFCTLYAGGKYNTNSGESYEYSKGLNGLGTTATQFASEYMDVLVRRDGYEYTLRFEKGENIGGLQKKKCDYESTGTTITWKPDLDVFTDINIPLEFYQELLKRQAIVNKGITFELYDEASEENFTYYYEKGIVDYIEEINGGKELSSVQYIELETKGRDRADKPEYKVKAEVAFAFNNHASHIEYYHNSSYLEYGGAPDKAVKSAFLSAIEQYLKNNNLYKKDEKRAIFADIEDSLVLISNSYSTLTSFENQTKRAISNVFIQSALTDFLKEKLQIYFIENKVEADKIANQIIINKRSRESAEKTRINVKKKLESPSNFANKVAKFVDCKTKDKSKRELYIVEGDSAMGSTKQGRDSEFQAIMPVRGKILNCLKAKLDNIFNDSVIVDLLKVLSCGIEIKSKNNTDLYTFELDKLNWDKVIICTDADVDGYQIRTLILAMLYRLVPTLLREGKVYIAETPLFEIISTTLPKLTDKQKDGITFVENKGDKNYSIFVYSDQQRDFVVSKLKGKYAIQRSKGLGENEPEMMWQTTMNPQTRKLIQVTMSDAQKADDVFDLLLGNNLEGRKVHIAENGHKYLEQIDVS